MIDDSDFLWELQESTQEDEENENEWDTAFREISESWKEGKDRQNQNPRAAAGHSHTWHGMHGQWVWSMEYLLT